MKVLKIVNKADAFDLNKMYRTVVRVRETLESVRKTLSTAIYEGLDDNKIKLIERMESATTKAVKDLTGI